MVWVKWDSIWLKWDRTYSTIPLYPRPQHKFSMATITIGLHVQSTRPLTVAHKLTDIPQISSHLLLCTLTYVGLTFLGVGTYIR